MELISKIKESKEITEIWKKYYIDLVSWFIENFDNQYTDGTTVRNILNKLCDADDYSALSKEELTVLDLAGNIYDSILEMHMCLMEKECPNHLMNAEEEYKTSEINLCWEQYNNGKFNQDILTYMPNDYEGNVFYDYSEDFNNNKSRNL